MDDSITAPLHDIFMAYSLPWGVLKDQGAATRTSPLRPGLSPRKGSGIQGIVTNVADAMDAIGWQRLCADCKLDEDTSLPPARPVFQQIAQGNSLEFDGFVKVLQAVARARYGDHDDMARLVYFKLLRSAKASMQNSQLRSSSNSQPHTPRGGGQATPRTPRGGQVTPRLSDLSPPSSEPCSVETRQYLKRLRELHRSVAHKCAPMYELVDRLQGEAHLMSSFERYRAGAEGVGLQGLAQMCSDLKLLPSPLCYAQIRSAYHAKHPAEGVGLDYSSFLDVLPALASIAFSGTQGDPTEKLMATIRRHVPPPLTHIAAVIAEDTAVAEHPSDGEDEDPTEGSVRVRIPVLTNVAVADGTLNADDDADGLSEAISKVKIDAQRKLERLAEEFAAKQVELQRQREAAEQKLEAELQFELAQNVVHCNARQKRATRPSTERLNLEEKLAALERTRARRPSRSDVHDDASEQLDQERAELTRKVHALKAAEEAKQAAEAEHEQQRKSRRIYANQEKMRLHLEQESARLDDALHTDMQKKHGEIRTWYETATRLCREKHIMKMNTPKAVARPGLSTPRSGKSTPRSTPRTPQARLVFAAQSRSIPPINVGTGSSTPVANGLKLDISSAVRGTALGQVQQHLQGVFSSIYTAFVFLDANDKGELDRPTFQRQLMRIAPLVSVDQIMMEMLEGAEEDPSNGDHVIPVELFLRHLSWHAIPSQRRAQREAVAEARRQKQKALQEFYRWQLRTHPKMGGAPGSAITLDDLALLPVHEMSEAAPGTSSARSASAYATWKGTLRKYNTGVDERAKSAPRSRPLSARDSHVSADAFQSPRPQRENFATPRAWISNGQKQMMQAKLLREKRQLAVQLLEAERKLAEAEGSSKSKKTKSSSDKNSNGAEFSKLPGGAFVERGQMDPEAIKSPVKRRTKRTQSSTAPEREHREFVGPRGPYREVSATDRIAALLKDDRPDWVQKCITKTGLFMATPPQGICIARGEQSAACWRVSSPHSMLSPANGYAPARDERTSRNTTRPPRTKTGASVPPNERIIDECLDLVSGLLRRDAHEKGRGNTSSFNPNRPPMQLRVDSPSPDSDDRAARRNERISEDERKNLRPGAQTSPHTEDQGGDDKPDSVVEEPTASPSPSQKVSPALSQGTARDESLRVAFAQPVPEKGSKEPDGDHKKRLKQTLKLFDRGAEVENTSDAKRRPVEAKRDADGEASATGRSSRRPGSAEHGTESNGEKVAPPAQRLSKKMQTKKLFADSDSETER